MSIGSSPIRPDFQRTQDVSTARTSYEQQSRSASPTRPAAANELGDQVSISDEARALASPAESEELSFSKLALRAVKPISNDRIADIQEKLAQGFYLTPAVTDSIAGSVADELSTAVI